MASEQSIALDFIINADKANLSLGELEQGYEALKNEIKNTNRSTKEGQAEFKRLSTELAVTGREVKNLELSFEALDNEQVASELGSVAGAVGDVTASFVLLGGENETMQEMAASIEKAMAISMGFKGAIEGVSSGMKLYNNLLKTGKIQTVALAVAQKAMAIGAKVLNAVLSLNPLGIIILAVTGAIAAFVAFGGTIKEFISSALAPFQFAIDAVVDALQWLGIMASDEAIAVEKASQDIIDSSKARREEIDKLLEANKKQNDEVIAGIDFEIRKRKAQGLDVTELELKKLETLIFVADQEKKLQLERLEGLKAEIQARIRLGDVTKEEMDEFAVMAKEQIDSLNSANNNKKRAIEDLAIYKLEQEKSSSDETLKVQEESAKKSSDIANKRAEEDKKLAAEKLAREIADDDFELALYEQFIAKEKELKAIKLEDERLLDLQKLADYDAFIQESKEIEEQAHLDTLQKIEEEKEARLAAAQANLAAAGTLVTSLSSLSDAKFASDMAKAGANEIQQEKARKKQFEREKKLQLAMAAINGAQALVSIFAQYPKFDGGFAMVAALAASVITTGASIAKIKSTKYAGGAGSAVSPTLPSAAGGAAEGSGGAQIDPVSNTNTVIGNNKVFVSETDITGTQNKVNVIEQSATF